MRIGPFNVELERTREAREDALTRRNHVDQVARGRHLAAIMAGDNVQAKDRKFELVKEHLREFRLAVAEYIGFRRKGRSLGELERCMLEELELQGAVDPDANDFERRLVERDRKGYGGLEVTDVWIDEAAEFPDKLAG